LISGLPSAAQTSTASAEVHSVTRLGAVLVGGNEVSSPGDPDGFGLADVGVRRTEICWRVSVSGVEPIAAAHIHAGPRGVNGPVVVTLDPYRSGCTEVRRRLARFIKQQPGDFYVNVHNAEFPAGALRGQLRR
jgi:hypothetical protein